MMAIETTVVIHHANCMDGICAAWAARQRFPDADLVPATHGTAPPLGKLTGRDVYVVDFSYPRPILETIASVARTLVVLDHHQTAAEDLHGFPGAVFDMHRSGAGLTWDHLLGSASRPWIVDYVEDRDLWRFALPESREVNAYLGTLPYNVEAWSRASHLALDVAKQLGAGAWAFLDAWAQAMAQETTRVLPAVLLPDGQVFRNIPVANVAPKGGSEVLSHLVSGVPFAAMWHRGASGHYYYGLRSAPEGVDVSTIARQYGGGGHAHAAGFRSNRLVWE